MSREIDERVVEMRFDNKQFENNVQTSMSTLEKLKQSLNLTGASKGLEDVNAAAKNCNMSGLTNAVETVRVKFSALEVMAVTALANITNSALNAGKQLLHSLTIEPISQGFSEYELKMGSIQTIMASTGESLDTVSGYLQDLNTYADKTIYSFSDMTSNIGKFTNAGVKLDDAVKAIQGISNEAAVSGANANEASRAMYNFAQALSAGSVKLIDWKSIENANMATVEFKNELLKTALALGTVVESNGKYISTTTDAQGKVSDAFTATSNFNESLSAQWMTTDVLVKTLGLYADETTEIGKKAFAAAQDVKTFTQLLDTLKEAVGSGWATTWEILFGDFEEAKKLWTSVSEVVGGFIDEQSTARNDMLQGWKDLGGRADLIDAVKNAFEGLISAIKPVKEAFTEIFPPVTSEQLHNITNGLKELTSHLKLSEENSANLKSTFKGLFAVLDIIKQAFSAIFKAVSPLFGGFGTLGGSVLSVTGNFGEWLVKLNETIKTTDIFNKVVQEVSGFVKSAAEAIKNFVQAIKEKFNFPGLEIFHSFLEKVHERMAQVGDAAGNMQSGVSAAVGLMGEALANSKFLQALETLWNGVKTIGGGIASALGSLVSGLIDNISGADFNGVFDIVNGLISGGIGIGLMKFLKSVTDTFKGFQDITDGIVDIFDGVRGCMEAYQTQLKAGTLLKIAGAIGILAASILVISTIDSGKLTASLGAITVLFADLMGAMAIFGKIGDNLTGVTKTCAAMLSISVAILILASALKKIGDLNFEQMVTGLVGIVGLTATMVATAKVLGNGSSTIIKGATQMVIFAASIKILASACEDLSGLSWEQLAKGLTGVGVLLAEVSLFLNTAKFSGKSITTATGIVILSASIKILASACNDFGQMEWGEIGKGLAAIGGLLAEIALFTNLTGNAKHVISTGVAMVAIGAAMKIFASAVSDFATLSWVQIGIGLSAMGGALAEVAISTQLMPKNMIGIGTGLVIVGAALEIVADALGKIGSFSWDQIGKGLTVMGGALAELAIGLNLMKGTFGGSAAMLVAAAALAVLTPVLSILGAMSWESIAKGLVAVAGAFAVVGVAGLVLTPLVPTILGLGAAFTLIGVGVLGIGAGLLAAGAGLSGLAIGFAALAAAGATGATAVVAALTVIITGVAGLIPVVIAKIGEGIVAFAGVIANGMPAIIEAVRQIGIGLVQVLVEITPSVVAALLTFLSTLLAQLAEAVPQMVESGMKLLLGILQGISKNIKDIVAVSLQIVAGFLQGLAEGIPDVVSAGVDIIVAFLDSIANETPRIIDAGFKMIIDFVNGLADAIRENTGPLVESFFNLAGAMVEGLVNGLIGGVKSAVDAVKNVGNAIIDGFKNLLGIHSPSKVFEELGEDTVDGYSKGVDESTPEAEAAAKRLADATINKAYKSFAVKNDKSEIFKELGVANAEGFISGLTSMSDAIKEAMTKAFAVDEKALKVEFGADKEGYEKALEENKAMVSNMHNVVDEALTTIEERLDSYTELATDRMSRIDTESETTAAEMITNLKHNQMAISEWAEDIAELAKRGLNDGLLEELRAAGPKSAGEVKALVEASDKELQTLNEVMSRGGKVATEALATSVGQGAPLMLEPGQSLADALAQGLASSGSVNEAMALLIDQTKTIAMSKLNSSEFKDLGKNIPEGLGAGIADNTEGVKTAATEMADGTNEAVKESFGIHSPSVLYAEYGKNLLLGLAEGIKNNISEPINAISTLLTEMETVFTQAGTKLGTNFVMGLQSVQTTVNLAASGLMTQFINGLNSQNAISIETMSSIIAGCLTVIKNKYYEFQSTGQAAMVQFIAGIRLKDSAVSSALIQIVSGAITAVKNKYSEFYNAGRYLVEGFAEGISDNTRLAEEAAREMAKAAARAAERELDEHSPSKVGYRIGDYFGLAFVNAIGDYTSKAYKASSEMADSAKKGLDYAISKITDMINGNIDTQPTIRPVLDLSEVESGAGKLNTLFSMNRALSISNARYRASGEESQDGVAPPATGSTFTFTQNNYSPKALSRLEIYRQTKNQISAMKGLVKA